MRIRLIEALQGNMLTSCRPVEKSGWTSEKRCRTRSKHQKSRNQKHRSQSNEMVISKTRLLTAHPIPCPMPSKLNPSHCLSCLNLSPSACGACPSCAPCTSSPSCACRVWRTPSSTSLQGTQTLKGLHLLPTHGILKLVPCKGTADGADSSGG